MDKVRELLEALHVPTATITTLLDADKSASVDIDAVAGGVKDHYKMVLENDPAFIDPIRNAERGKVLGSKENKLLKFGAMTRAEYEAGGMKFDELLEKTIEHVVAEAKKGGSKATEEYDKLAAELRTWREKAEKLETEVLPQKEAEKAAFITSYKIDQALSAMVRAHETVVPHHVLEPAYLAKLRTEYDVALTDTGAVELRQRGTELKAIDAKGKPVTVDGWLKSAFEADKVLKVNGTPPLGGGGEGGKPEPSKPKVSLPGMRDGSRAAQMREELGVK